MHLFKNLGAQWGRCAARGYSELPSGPKSIFFIEKLPLREYFLLSIRKNALYPRFLGDRGQILRSELFLDSIQLLPDPLMLIVGMRVERDALCSVLLLRCLQLREHLTVSADFLALELLGVRNVSEKLADPVQLAAESVDIVAEVRAVIIVSLIFHRLNDSADLANASMKVFQLRVDLALDDFQIRDHDADPHY